MLEAVRDRALARLDDSIEQDKDPNPFLHGVPAILDALRSGQTECRIYDRDKFHAKAYITHAKLEVVGAQALVGSSNFTQPDLERNVELNVQVQSAREVAQLQDAGPHGEALNPHARTADRDQALSRASCPHSLPEGWIRSTSVPGVIPLRNLNISLSVERTSVVFSPMMDLYACMVRVNS